jgi:hypothetical protein
MTDLPTIRTRIAVADPDGMGMATLVWFNTARDLLAEIDRLTPTPKAPPSARQHLTQDPRPARLVDLLGSPPEIGGTGMPVLVVSASYPENVTRMCDKLRGYGVTRLARHSAMETMPEPVWIAHLWAWGVL